MGTAQAKFKRYRSSAHLKHVRKFVCSRCEESAGIEAAHVRTEAEAGMALKPDDWRAVSLCGPCHAEQHRLGEITFWSNFDVEALIAAFIASSPKRHEIRKAQEERE